MTGLPEDHREPLVVINTRIYARQHKKLSEIAQERHLLVSSLVRTMLDTYLRVYINVHSGEFCCQSCGTVTKNRHRHDVVVGDEIFSFGDCCYFNDKYKQVILRMI